MPIKTTHDRSPLPPIVFRVGITGHRPNRLDPNLIPELAETIAEVLAFVRQIVFSVPPLRPEVQAPTLRLLTSLAEGTDRMAAHAALNLGFEVQVPLPFPQDEYEKDFASPGSLDEFRGLLARADSIFQLNADPLGRELGYRAAGEVVLMQSDLLLAVWDGHAAHGVGGTGELVERAQLVGLPVLRIDSAAPKRIELLDSDGAHPDALVALEAYIRSLFILTGRVTKKSLANPSGEIGSPRRRNGRIRFAALVHPQVDTAVGFAKDYIRARFPSTQHAAHDVPEIENESLRPYFLWTDALAVRYGQFSRSAALRIQFWAALAVVSCLLTIPLESNLSLVRLLSCLELIATLAVLIEAFVAWRLRWHSRWLIFRSVAEQIRCLDLLAPLALGTTRLHGFSAQDRGTREGFAFFFTQNLVRSIGLPSVKIDAAYLSKQTHHLLQAIERQRRFHKSSRARYQKLEYLLTRGGTFVFVLTFGVCAYNVLHAFNLTHHHSHWLTVCTALLLSLGMTIAALAAQGEFKRLAKRSDGMWHVLNLLDRRLRVAPPASLRAVTVAATEVSDILMNEVRDWEALLSAKPPSVNI